MVRMRRYPTVLPSLVATLTPAQAMFVSVRNGFLVKNGSGALLGGAQGFEVTWSGALLVDDEGTYEFSAEVPARPPRPPLLRAARMRSSGASSLKRGSRTWVVVSHRWPGEEERKVFVSTSQERRVRADGRVGAPRTELHERGSTFIRSTPAWR